MTRIEVRGQIISCTNCRLSASCRAPVPFDGPSPAFLGVVGEAPGRQEDQEGRPFVGPAGQLLKELLRDAGFDINQVMFMNAASCFPLDFQGKGRAPNDVELEACSENLRAQMELSGASMFLLTGAVPLKALRKGLKIGQARGRPFFLDATQTTLGRRVAMATYHPSYVLRRGGEGSDAWQAVTKDLAFLRQLADSEPKLPLFPDSCIQCEEPSGRYDNDGIGWCLNHWVE